jgi:hypothetical protein
MIQRLIEFLTVRGIPMKPQMRLFLKEFQSFVSGMTPHAVIDGINDGTIDVPSE